MKTELSEYEQQAITFCQTHGVEISWEYGGHCLHFPDDKDYRAVWRATVTRREVTQCFDFGRSLVDSYWVVTSRGKQRPDRANVVGPWKPNAVAYWGGQDRGYLVPSKLPPTSYDLLATLTKYNPGLFEDFCGDFGYDTDSRKAEQTYFAVQKEWSKVHRLFRDCLDELRAIN